MIYLKTEIYRIIFSAIRVWSENMKRLLIKPENRMLNDGEKAGFSGKKREISGI